MPRLSNTATQYTIKLNGHTATHANYESASVAWQRVSQSAEDGRSITAELWRHNRYDWDDNFYHGMLNIDGTVPNGVIAVMGKCILTCHCIAAITYP